MAPTSIKDIARRVGVSHSTVSRALRDSPSISTATRLKVQQIAVEMGYSPSAIARGLVTRRTHTVGVVVTSLTDPFHSRVVEGIEMLAQDQGYGVLLTTSHEDHQRERAAVEMLSSKRVDGIIVAASRLGGLRLSPLKKLQVPIVLINSHQAGEYIYSVSTDDQLGGYSATRYLLGLGHSRIGYLGSSRGGHTDKKRLAGYRRALEEAGIALDEQLLSMGDGRAPGGREAMAKLLALPVPPTAVFCYNDLTAIGALQAVNQAGKKVPWDVSIVGFDGLDEAEYVIPPLTTMEQPRLQMGRIAMQMILDALAGRKSPARLVLQPNLIERASCRRLP